jgi:asparagine synthase (glutamine-hydrolysing)
MAVIHGMISSLDHRGPCSNGAWVDASRKFAMGHTRLSIQDLSFLGSQPMESPDGRYILVFNGEIYNHMAIRALLYDKVTFIGKSDTETLLLAIQTFGLEKAVSMSVGMFAFALWDNNSRVLTLARDRLGEKPLYYAAAQDEFFFGSELKAFNHIPGFQKVVDRDALAAFLRYSYVPAPYSIFMGVKKLLPGHFLEVCYSHSDGCFKLQERPYWSAREQMKTASEKVDVINFQDSVDLIRQKLFQAVQDQLISDVPIGAFLSGGIDSSTIVAIMQRYSSSSVKTFTIGYEESAYNEASDAKKVAQYLGTDHFELSVSAADALAVIPLLPQIYCEPFADSSQIPTYLVSKFAKQQVSVALSGDGADELFGGYNRYLSVSKLWRKIRYLPKSIRAIVSSSLGRVSPDNWDRFFAKYEELSKYPRLPRLPGDKIHKLADVLKYDDAESYYRRLISHFDNPSTILRCDGEREIIASPWADICNFPIESLMMLNDMECYLPDDILVKVDRAAMSNSLETRAPFLDHRLAEAAMSLPLSAKISEDGKGKYILREILKELVPESLVDRPKMGFGVPLAQWLRGPLKDWAEALLDERRLIQEGYFHAEAVRKLWSAHLTGKVNAHLKLWNILMFQSWLDQQGK